MVRVSNFFLAISFLLFVPAAFAGEFQIKVIDPHSTGIRSYVVNGGSSVPGFAFLASIIAIFSGAQLFALGIIGEYLARMHFRSMDRPTYLVRDVTDVE